jgi:hypothetical protein
MENADTGKIAFWSSVVVRRLQKAHEDRRLERREYIISGLLNNTNRGTFARAEKVVGDTPSPRQVRPGSEVSTTSR